MGDDFEREQNEDGEPVEHVVHRGPRERPAELGGHLHLTHGHDRVSHRGADVGAHHDRNGRRHRQNYNTTPTN